jgi:predicted nucleic acid-binding protein
LLTLDSSGILALLNRRDPDHKTSLRIMREDAGPYIMAVNMLAEASYMIDLRLGARALDAFLADLEEGAFTRDYGEDDLARIRALLERYADLHLGFADASVIACAERHGGRILTFDFRDFSIVAREGTIQLPGAP